MFQIIDHSAIGQSANANAKRPGALARWAGWAAFGVFTVLIVMALAVAATAVAVIALIVAVAMAALRVGVRRPADAPSDVLEGRRTAEGWIVEATPRPR